MDTPSGKDSVQKVVLYGRFLHRENTPAFVYKATLDVNGIGPLADAVDRR